MFEKIVSMLAEKAGCDPDTITPETTFESLGIDSLDTVEMVMELEDELDAELQLEEKVETVGALVAYIEGKLA